MMCVVVVEERMAEQRMMCVVELRLTGDAVDRMMIVEERMIGRRKDDVRHR